MIGIHKLNCNRKWKFHSFTNLRISIVYSCIALFMLGCERYESDAEVQEYTLNEVAPCLGEESPYEDFQIIQNISLGGTVSIPFNFETFNYELDVNAFHEGVSLTPAVVQNIFTPPVRADISDDDNDSTTLTLSDDQISALEKANIELSGVSISVKFLDNEGKETELSFEELIEEVYIPLADGENFIEVSYDANLLIPVIGAECDTFEEVDTRVLSLTKTYNIKINRNDVSDYVDLLTRKRVTLPNFVMQSGAEISSIAVDNDFLAIGLSNDSSSLVGVHSVDDITSLDDSMESSGAVVTYRRNSLSEEWVAEAYIKAPVLDVDDDFGHFVEIENNMLVVSSPGEDSIYLGAKTLTDAEAALDSDLVNDAKSNSGAVFAYRNLNSQWSLFAYIKKPTSSESYELEKKSFGDGLGLFNSQLFISDPYLSGGGVVRVYNLDNDSFSFSQALQAVNQGERDGFGFSFDVSSKVIAIGAPYEDSQYRNVILGLESLSADESAALNDDSSEDSGAVYVFKKDDNGSSWSQHAYLKSSNSDRYDHFGASVSTFGCESTETQFKEYYCHVFAGAPDEDGSSQLINVNLSSNESDSSGAVYLFKAVDNNLAFNESAYFKSPVNQASSQFGSSVETVGGYLIASQPLLTENDIVVGGASIFEYKSSTSDWDLSVGITESEARFKYGEMMSLSDKVLAIKSDSESLSVFH